MTYTKPEEILTYLPRSIRNSVNEAELISYIIRGYRSLKIPQDKDLRENNIYTETTNYKIKDNIKQIHTVHYLHESEDVDRPYVFLPVFPSNTNSELCGDVRMCKDCELTYSIKERTLRLPKPGTYRIVYNQLFSDQLEIFNDEDVKQYLRYYAMHEVLLERVISSDPSAQAFPAVLQSMNALYSKARGAALLQSIKLDDHKLTLRPINLTQDELNHGYYSDQPTRGNV